MKNELEKIYVVGFPKSGDTWLTRLLADLLNCPAGNGMNAKDEIEIASYVNNSKTPKNNRFKILKSHFLPSTLFSEVNNNIKKIVYIQRDFRDVVISSYFQKYKKTDESKVIYLPLKKLLTKNPFFIIFYSINRLKLYKQIKMIAEQWGKNNKIGGWSENISAYQNLKKNNILISYVRYEDLLKDTKGNMKKILAELKIPNEKESKIESTVKRQSFANKKKSIMHTKCIQTMKCL